MTDELKCFGGIKNGEVLARPSFVPPHMRGPEPSDEDRRKMCLSESIYRRQEGVVDAEGREVYFLDEVKAF